MVERGDYKSAKEIVESHINEIAGSDAFYYAAVSLIYAPEPDFEAADGFFAKGLELGASAFWTHYHWGNLHLRAGRQADAAREFAKAYETEAQPLALDSLMQILRGVASEADSGVFTDALKAAMPTLSRLWMEGGGPQPIRNPGSFRISSDALGDPQAAAEECDWTQGLRPEAEINDALYASVAHFQPVTLGQPVFVNSVPKAGTHLLRNLLLHFFGDAGLPMFLTVDTLPENLPLSRLGPSMVVGHLPFTADCLFGTRGIPQILLMRHPAEILLALARAAYDPRNERPDYVFARRFLTLHEYMTVLAQGYDIEGVHVDSFDQFMRSFLVDWTSQPLLLLDHSEVITAVSEPDSPAAEAIMATLLGYCGVGLPADWRDRATAAGNRDISSTYLPPLPAGRREAALDHAHNLVTCCAPGILAWYDRMAARKLGER